MTDLLERLRSVNPVRTCVPPQIHDVWIRLEHDNQGAPDAGDQGGTGRGRPQQPDRAFPRAWLGLRHAGLALTVAVPVLVAGLTIVLLGHNQPGQSQRPGGQPLAPARAEPARPGSSRPMSIDAALRRGIRPPLPNANRSLPILGSLGTRTLASFRGEVVVLSVFASWCVPCRAQARVLEQAQAHIAGQRATVLGVTYDDSRAAAGAFVRAEHVTYPVLRDPRGWFIRALRLGGVPETFVIDRLGRIAAARSYSASRRWLEHTLARVLAGGGSAGN